jgi:hypothetical protein
LEITRTEHRSGAAEDIVMRQQGEFLMARDGRLRYHIVGQGLMGDEKTTGPQDTDQAFDGECLKQFDPEPVSIGFPVGFIYPENEMLRGYALDPILWWLRIKPAALGGVNPMGFESDSQVGVVDGRQCVVVHDRLARKSYTFWLDPERGYLICRAYIAIGGKTRRQYDVRYDSEPTVGWVPRQCTMLEVGDDGSPIWSIDYQVTEHQINLPTQLRDFNWTSRPVRS